MVVTESCRAKLNLFLDVRGRRPDGYHELLTVFHEISLADELSASGDALAGEVTLTVEGGGSDVPCGPANLVVRAARALLEEAGSGAGVALDLRKSIPSGGGLGGGSADAAGALRAVNRLLDLGASAADLERIGLSVGSDVPFLVRGGTAIARGRGELLEPIDDVGTLRFLLLLPRFGLSTPAVFRALPAQLAPPHDIGPTLAALRAGDAEELARVFHNALEPAADRVDARLPALRAAAEASLARRVCLTGSGSTLFVPYTEPRPDEIVAADLRGTLLARSAQ